VAKTVPWEHRAEQLRNRVRDSEIETWTRKDIMQLFDVQSTAAKNILRAVGKVHKLGTSYFVERQDLLALLDKVLKRQSVTAEFRRNRLKFQRPLHQPIRVTLDERHRAMRAEDLPANITLEPGHLSIRGRDRQEVLESLKLLILALDHDFEAVSSFLDYVEERPESFSEMDALLRGLAKMREQRGFRPTRRTGSISSQL
jgi:hypothetical protein